MGKSLPASSATDRLLATVVVPTRNAGNRLQLLIDALERQTLGHNRFEVIVGDDGSTDGSTTALEAQRLSVTVSSGKARNSYAARNRAARMGRAPAIAFCDADCVPDPEWLERGLDALQEADVVVGDIRWQLPTKPTVWTLLDIELHVDPVGAVQEERCLGGNLFVSGKLFDELQGFDESLPSGGDTDFGRRAARAGARLTYCADARVVHPTYDTARGFLVKVWRVNRASAIRRVRAGETRRRVTRSSIPTLAMALARRRAGRPAGLDRARLEAAGLTAGRSLRLRAAAVLYLLVPYVGRAAAASGRRAAAM